VKEQIIVEEESKTNAVKDITPTLNKRINKQ
jgi:hypothetical protein